MTGVEEDEVRLAHFFGGLIPFARQRITHAGGVVDVHLAAVGLDEDLPGVGALDGLFGRSGKGDVFVHARLHIARKARYEVFPKASHSSGRANASPASAASVR
jgi:hypothetical protein